MAVTKVQSTNAQISGGNITLTLSGVVAGNLLTVQCSYLRNTVNTIPSAPTDSNGVSPLVEAAHVNHQNLFSTDVGGTGIWYKENAESGSHTVTFALTSGSGHATLTEWSPVLTSSSLDKSNTASTIGGSFQTQTSGTTAATTQADELALASFCVMAGGGNSNITITKDATYTRLSSGSNDLSDLAFDFVYKILSSTGTQVSTETWTDAESGQIAFGAIATFKAGSGGSPPTTDQLTPCFIQASVSASYGSRYV